MTKLDLGSSFFEHNNLAGCGRSLGVLMMAFPELVDVDLRGCRLKVSDVEAMAEVLRGNILKVVMLLHFRCWGFILYSNM